MLFGEGLPIARIAGFEVRITLPWVVLLALVTILASEAAAAAVAGPGNPPAEPAPGPNVAAWLIGGAAAIAMLVAVAAHELAHAAVARRYGVGTTTIVLSLAGIAGAFEIQGRRPREEAQIALAGPVASIAIGLILLPIAAALGSSGGTATMIGSGLLVVAGLDLAFVALSLLPGLPLDGGRLIRAVAWARTGDRRRAGAIAARAGRVLGWAVAIAGLALSLVVSSSDGLIVIALGWFLYAGARTADRRNTLFAALEGVRVDDATERDLPHLAPGLTIDVVADLFLPRGPASSLPVLDDGGLAGVLGIDRLQRLGRRAATETRVGDLMVRPPLAPVLRPEDRFVDALEALRRARVDGLAVANADGLVGVLTRRRAAAIIQARLPNGRLESRLLAEDVVGGAGPAPTLLDADGGTGSSEAGPSGDGPSGDGPSGDGPTGAASGRAGPGADGLPGDDGPAATGPEPDGAAQEDPRDGGRG